MERIVSSRLSTHGLTIKRKILSRLSTHGMRMISIGLFIIHFIICKVLLISPTNNPVSVASLSRYLGKCDFCLWKSAKGCLPHVHSHP